MVISRTTKKKIIAYFSCCPLPWSDLVGDLHLFFPLQTSVLYWCKFRRLLKSGKFWQLMWTKLYFLRLDSIRQLMWQVLPGTQWKILCFFQSALNAMEDKLNQAQLELQQLQNSVRSYEGLIENYTAQVGLRTFSPCTKVFSPSTVAYSVMPQLLAPGAVSVTPRHCTHVLKTIHNR